VLPASVTTVFGPSSGAIERMTARICPAGTASSTRAASFSV